MMSKHLSRAQRGFTFIELSLAVVLLGIVATWVWAFGVQKNHSRALQETRTRIQRAELAIEAYAMLHGALPCPASDTHGRAASGVQCAGQGFFPFIDTGVPDDRLGQLSYTLDRIELAQPGAAFTVLMPIEVHAPNGPSLSPHRMSLSSAIQTFPHDAAPDLYDSTPDLCEQLRTGTGSAGRAFSLQDSARTGTSAATQPSSLTVSAGRLWTRLNCSSTISTRGRSHFNAHLAAQAFSKVMNELDSQAQLGIKLDQLTLVDLSITASNDVRRFAARAFDEPVVAFVTNIASDGAKPGPLFFANIGVAVAAMAKSALNLTRAGIVLSHDEEDAERTDRLTKQANAFATLARSHALDGASSSYFLEKQ